jgi:hypothetical protein
LQDDWREGFVVVLSHTDDEQGRQYLDCGTLPFRSQLACLINASCPEGSNCIAFQHVLAGEECLLVVAQGTLDPETKVRRPIEPGEYLTWNYTGALVTNRIHVECNFCNTRRVQQIYRGVRRLEKDLTQSLLPCCSLCYCRLGAN